MSLIMRNTFLIFWFSLVFSTSLFAAPWIIAIDPGHGGKDPGAIGRNKKIQEKNVTLSIARELKILLDKDPRFKTVLTRKGDYYISVPARSEIARKYKANYLVSIHADSSVSNTARGASVWVLSNRRANSEMGKWLEDNEKRSELLGGAGSLLSSHKDRYLDQTVIDLQFGHSQRVGYELGSIVLRYFSKIAPLSHSEPQHASLGVLRSPDIPSILVETGFLSNKEEESKLATLTYRKKIARIIYNGLVEYRTKIYKNEDSVKIKSTDGNKSSAKNSKENNEIKDSGIRHKVKRGENLSKLARTYGVRVQDISTFNKLNRKELWVGETLKIPANDKNAPVAKSKQENAPVVKPKSKKVSGGNEKKFFEKSTALPKNNADKNSKNKTEKINNALPKFHTVRKGQTLYSIAREYSIPVSKLQKLNPKLKNGKVLAGQRIKLQD